METWPGPQTPDLGRGRGRSQCLGSWGHKSRQLIGTGVAQASSRNRLDQNGLESWGQVGFKPDKARKNHKVF